MSAFDVHVNIINASNVARAPFKAVITLKVREDGEGWRTDLRGIVAFVRSTHCLETVWSQPSLHPDTP
jgi:hypothetical protein